MTTIRPFKANDLFKFNISNFNNLTPTNSTNFYAKILVPWPEYCFAVDSPNGELIGYIHSKFVIDIPQHSGHICMLSVIHDYQKLGIASNLMTIVENLFGKKNVSHIDLYCRVGNQHAMDLYTKFDYKINRVIKKMYSDGEDGNDMRKILNNQGVAQKSN